MQLIEAGLKTDNAVPPSEIIATLIGSAEWPGRATPQPTGITSLVATDRFKAALGRISCMYDGGHLQT